VPLERTVIATELVLWLMKGEQRRVLALGEPSAAPGSST
jgi:hypothetical protein